MVSIRQHYIHAISFAVLLNDILEFKELRDILHSHSQLLLLINDHELAYRERNKD